MFIEEEITIFFRIREVRGEKNDVTNQTVSVVVKNVAVAVLTYAFTTSKHYVPVCQLIYIELALKV